MIEDKLYIIFAEIFRIRIVSNLAHKVGSNIFLYRTISNSNKMRRHCTSVWSSWSNICKYKSIVAWWWPCRLKQQLCWKSKIRGPVWVRKWIRKENQFAYPGTFIKKLALENRGVYEDHVRMPVLFCMLSLNFSVVWNVFNIVIGEKGWNKNT
jgi:hypothetical protein